MLSPAAAGLNKTFQRSNSLNPLSEILDRVVGRGKFQKSYALVVGVGDYDVYPKLGAPAKDAVRVADFLRDDAGFDYVVILTDEEASKAEIERLLETVFPELVGKNDRFLFYFSGHGVTRKVSRQDEGYLVLKNSKNNAWNEMINMSRVIDYAKYLGSARHGLFILDACFSGIAALQIKGDQREMKVERLSQPAQHLLTAGVENENSFALDTESVFTSAFLRAARGDARSSSRSDVVSLSEIVLEINQSIDELRVEKPAIKMSPQKYLLRNENNAGEFFFIKKARSEGYLQGRTGDPGAGGVDVSGPSDVRIPNRVTIGPDTVLFHPATGAPLLWFVRDGFDYDFFDGSGFHPRTGAKLAPFTKEEALIFEKRIREKEAEIRREAERVEKDRADREARDFAAKEALARKQEEDRKLREAEAARASEAGQRCDELAANPNDRNKVGQGASFSALKAQAADAVKACDLALKQKPSELRFKYQLARALQFSDRPRSFKLHKELVGQGYAASYDNLGWMYYTDRKDKPQAIVLFRQGIQVGDVDSMVSLAELVDRAEATPANASESKIELCRRAAELGHVGAAQCYQVEVAKQEQAEKDRAQQLEQQKMMIQLMGTIIQSATRR
ncbi:hypothetical protein I8G32_03957 [Rhodopseudomonas palustris]|nr:hypothetical protein I8G32_03957 [Rhodopseudomonas palustris]